MKRILTFLMVSMLCFGFASAQTAPDFTATDTDGNTLNLYGALNAGNIVVLDFFFTTCPPCINHVPDIEHVYQQFGAGANNVLIWGINDRNTNAEVDAYKSQYGVSNPCVSGTQGGGYDVYSLYANTYPFVGFPTYSVICPDKSITWDIWPISTNAPEVAAAINNCPQSTGVGDLASNETGILKLFPNPASDRAQLTYHLKNNARVEVGVYNMLGEVMILSDAGQVEAGTHQIRLNTASLAAGQYFVRLVADDKPVQLKKLNIIK